MTNNTPSISSAYHHIKQEELPEQIELTLIAADGKREVLRYQKVRWQTADRQEPQGLRYGENPQQRAAFYRLANDTIEFDQVTIETAALKQISGSELIQSGKHPGKINITDLDCGVQLLRYNMDEPTAIVIKHNNPCAVARAATISEACVRAHRADSISAFGGVMVLNRSVDVATAEYISAHYFELIAAPEYETGSIALLQQRKNLRIIRINNMESLPQQRAMRLLHLHTLSDLSLCLQDQYLSSITSVADMIPATATHNDDSYQASCHLDAQQLDDALFGWHVVESLWSNAVCFVKDGCTVGIGCGAVDRMGAVQIAIDKAYRNYKERFAQQHFNTSYHLLTDAAQQNAADADALLRNGGLVGSILCSDAFFPFPDGVQLAIRERVGGVVEPGGSINDWQVIELCNKMHTPLLFTGKRAFRH